MNSYPACEPRRRDDPLDVELTHRLNDQMLRQESDGIGSDAPVIRELVAWMMVGAVLCGLCLALLV